jgi:O-antigen/teichoic acid export membrane protein
MLRSTSLLRTAASSLGLRVAAAGLGLINGILLGRLLGPAELGVYSIALSIVNFLATVAVLGLPTLATREVASSVEHARWNHLRTLVRSVHRWTVLAALSVLGMSAIVLGAGIFEPPVSWGVVLIVMVLVPAVALNLLRAGILRGLHRVLLADIPELVLRPGAMLLMLGGAYVTVVHAGAFHALAMQLVAVGAALAVGTWWLVIRRPAELKAAVLEVPQRAWLRDALPFLAITMINALAGQVSLYLLGYLGGAGHAGLYHAANQLVGVITIGLVAVNMPLQPKLAAAWARGSKTEAQRLVAETARIGTAVAFAGMLVLLLFAESLLGLYGAQYVEAGDALRVLAAGQLINAAAGSCGILLMMTGHQKAVMHGMALALVVNALTAYLAVPTLGVVGGALAAVLGIACWNVYLVVYAARKLGVDTTVRSSMRR